MTLQALLEATQRDSQNPGYARAANDCLLEVVEPENAEQWLAAAQTFATLALAEQIGNCFDYFIRNVYAPGGHS